MRGNVTQMRRPGAAATAQHPDPMMPMEGQHGAARSETSSPCTSAALSRASWSNDEALAW